MSGEISASFKSLSLGFGQSVMRPVVLAAAAGMFITGVMLADFRIRAERGTDLVDGNQLTGVTFQNREGRDTSFGKMP